MSIDGHARARLIPNEHSDRISQHVAWIKCAMPHAFGDANYTGKMTLRADAVAPGGIELHRVHDGQSTADYSRSHTSDVLFPRPVTPFAADAALSKRLSGEAVHSADTKLDPAGMAI